MGWKQPKFDEEDISYLVLIGIIILTLSLLFIPYKTLTTVNMPVKFEIIDEKYDLENIQKNTLDFGKVSQGYRIKREIKLSLNKAQPAIAYIEVDKNIKKFIEIQDKVYVKEDLTIPIELNILKDSKGKYEGNIKIIYKQTLIRKIKNILE